MGFLSIYIFPEILNAVENALNFLGADGPKEKKKRNYNGSAFGKQELKSQGMQGKQVYKLAFGVYTSKSFLKKLEKSNLLLKTGVRCASKVCFCSCSLGGVGFKVAP